MYNILWIDDEWDKNLTFQEECMESYDLLLEPYRTRKEGIEALEKDLEHWDAVLLDAKMFDETDNERASLTGLMKAKQRLDELKIKRNIPYFISTGQPDLLSNDDFRDMFGDFFEKGKDDIKLMGVIKNAIEKSDTSQIRFFYQDVFDALASLGIQESSEDILSDIFVAMHYPSKSPNFRPTHHYNLLRQLLEYMFRACNNVGLIPDQCVMGTNINLNQCSLYLAGRNANLAGVRYGNPGERIIPEYIEAFIRSILDFGNTHSHTVKLTNEDQEKIESILRTKKSRFVIFSLAMQICEVIIWLAEYIAQHNDKEVNLLYCTELPKGGEQYNGKEYEPVQDENGIWHCDECIVAIQSWIPGRKMRLKDVQPNTRDTKNKYPFYAKYDRI